MTRNNAINELKAIKSVYGNKNLFPGTRLMKSELAALDMAIEALRVMDEIQSAINDCEKSIRDIVNESNNSGKN